MAAKRKTVSLNEVEDTIFGKKGTLKREKYEQELKLEILGELIKEVRKERNLTQEQLGKIVGVQKAQISKLENNMSNVTLDTFLKVFQALKAKIFFKVELTDGKLQLH
jgi:HTH-type transcriptional regulator/antitoxin HipB